MPSLDIVFTVDLQEVDNAVNLARKEIGQRFDFKGTHNEIALEKDCILILAADNYKLTAVVDILRSKLARRNVSLTCLEFGKQEPASRGAVRQRITLIQGIDKDRCSEIVKLIKGSKLKVQAQMMDDQVRVSGKKIDDLQAIIQLLKSKDFGIDLQFVNMRR